MTAGRVRASGQRHRCPTLGGNAKQLSLPHVDQPLPVWKPLGARAVAQRQPPWFAACRVNDPDLVLALALREEAEFAATRRPARIPIDRGVRGELSRRAAPRRHGPDVAIATAIRVKPASVSYGADNFAIDTTAGTR